MANQKLWKRHAEWNVSHGGSHRGEPSQQGGGRLASPCYTGQQNNPVSRVTLDLRWLSLILLCETQPGYHFFFFLHRKPNFSAFPGFSETYLHD